MAAALIERPDTGRLFEIPHIGGGHVIVERVKPGGCGVKPVGDVRRREPSAKPFVGAVAFRSPQRVVQKGGGGGNDSKSPHLLLYR